MKPNQTIVKDQLLCESDRITNVTNVMQWNEKKKIVKLKKRGPNKKRIIKMITSHMTKVK